ncbi:MAG: hypothetical protein ACFFD4_19010 [Candidatus Odinarchaeota archaeon]
MIPRNPFSVSIPSGLFERCRVHSVGTWRPLCWRGPPAILPEPARDRRFPFPSRYRSSQTARFPAECLVASHDPRLTVRTLPGKIKNVSIPLKRVHGYDYSANCFNKTAGFKILLVIQEEDP